jgi:hypothetical protein
MSSKPTSQATDIFLSWLHTPPPPQRELKLGKRCITKQRSMDSQLIARRLASLNSSNCTYQASLWLNPANHFLRHLDTTVNSYSCSALQPYPIEYPRARKASAQILVFLQKNCVGLEAQSGLGKCGWLQGAEVKYFGLLLRSTSAFTSLIFTSPSIDLHLHLPSRFFCSLSCCNLIESNIRPHEQQGNCNPNLHYTSTNKPVAS